MIISPRIISRAPRRQYAQAMADQGVHPLLARLWAARGQDQATQLEWPNLLPPAGLAQLHAAASLLAQAIADGERLLVVADYDCDGASACALAIRALKAMGARVDYFVPNRFETGYGLSPAVVDLACQHPAGKPDMLITVDNGIASVEGVAAANAAGMRVIITDHHLPGAQLPEASAIVNPNQPACGFSSKNLAGVGVIFYLMLELRAVLRARGVYPPGGGPRLAELADLVALGTVADVVRLDVNNRLLVTQGLQRIRQGRMHAGIAALFALAGRDPQKASASDLGFAIGPRINAAGRMADMSIGIACLLSDDPEQAHGFARQLEEINLQRRERELGMQEQALDLIGAKPSPASICVWQNDWHAGIVGLVAARLKERYWRPCIAFAGADAGVLRGSGRSVAEVHLRDVLDLVSKSLPGAILQFGGHAMAAGLSLREAAYDDFCQHFDDAVRTLSGRDSFEPVLETDGSLELQYCNTASAELLQQQVWGAGFARPQFHDEFRVINQRILKDKHLKLRLQRQDFFVDAIWFGHNTELPEYIQAVYQLDINTWNNASNVQLLIQYAAGA